MIGLKVEFVSNQYSDPIEKATGQVIGMYRDYETVDVKYASGQGGTVRGTMAVGIDILLIRDDNGGSIFHKRPKELTFKP